jgi:hypothetical protein
MLISFSTPWIVQRISKRSIPAIPFEKGIILEKGLVEEIGKIFESMMIFDYMGSSEFEWGALPKSLEYAVRYAKDKDYVACEIEVESRKNKNTSVFYICHKDIEEPVVSWIRKAAKDEHQRCQEGVRLQEAIDKEYCYNACGWYDLENRFWFFTDRDMFLNIKKLFGV